MAEITTFNNRSPVVFHSTKIHSQQEVNQSSTDLQQQAAPTQIGQDTMANHQQLVLPGERTQNKQQVPNNTRGKRTSVNHQGTYAHGNNT